MGHYLDLGTGCCGLGTLSRWLSYKEFRRLQSSSETLAWCSLFSHYRRHVEATVSGLRQEANQRNRNLEAVASVFF